MKLDPRIIKGKKPLTCFDTEEAKQFIGKECYFCDCSLAFEDLDKFTTLVKGNLYRVQDTEKPFLIDMIACSRYAYCLPCEWVKKKEQESVWKPYDLDTLREDKIFFGEAVTFRRKTDDNSARIVTAIYNGKSENSDDLDDSEILLGGEWYGFQRLFDEYEMFDNKYSDDNLCKWRPFGYQE